jgi:hypothetical protein
MPTDPAEPRQSFLCKQVLRFLNWVALVRTHCGQCGDPLPEPSRYLSVLQRVVTPLSEARASASLTRFETTFDTTGVNDNGNSSN